MKGQAELIAVIAVIAIAVAAVLISQGTPTGLAVGTPTGLDAKHNSEAIKGTIDLEWDIVSGADNYEIYWGATSTADTYLYTKAGASYTHAIPSPQAIKYYYKVRACNTAEGCGSFSNVVNEFPKIGVTALGPFNATIGETITLTSAVEYAASPPVFPMPPIYTWTYDYIESSALCIEPADTETTTTSCSTDGTAVFKLSVYANYNDTEEDTITITIGDNTPPEITIVAPTDGEGVSGTIQINANPYDPSGIDNTIGVKFEIDGIQKCVKHEVTDNPAGPDYYTCDWDTTENTDGTHTITVSATDTKGNSGSASITVNVSNTDPTYPDVTITQPAEMEKISGTYAVKVTALDLESGIDKVNFYVDGLPKDSDNTPPAPFTWNWDTTIGEYPDGQYELLVEAINGAGLASTDSVNVVIENNPDLTDPVVSFLNPSNGDTVRETTDIIVTASDPESMITEIEISIDSIVKKTCSEPSSATLCSYSWNTTAEADGSTHTIQAKVTNGYGTTKTVSIDVTVDNSVNPLTPLWITAEPGDYAGTIKVNWEQVPADNYIVEWEETLPGRQMTTSQGPININVNDPNKERKSYTFRATGCTTIPQDCGDWTDEVTAYPKIGAAMSCPTEAQVNQEIMINGWAEYASEPITKIWNLTETTGCTETYYLENLRLTCPTARTVTVSLTINANSQTATTDTVEISITEEGDSTPPEVSISSHVTGDNVSRDVTITATATDAGGIKQVKFFIDGTEKTPADTTFPYEYQWDTTGLDDGTTYTLKAEAEDNSGNTKTSDEVVVTVDNSSSDTIPPTVEITAPLDGETREGTVNITATATDSDTGIQNVKFYVNDILKTTDSSYPYSYSWGTAQTADGTLVSIKAKATDGAGNTAEDEINVTIDNSGAECGNNVCETGENNSNCPNDCPATPSCGNGTIDLGEDCEEDADCSATIYPRTDCDTQNQKYGTRSITCSACDCTAGQWNYSETNYCNNCDSCGDGTQNCNETCETCPSDVTGCVDEPPAKPTGLEIVRTTEDSIILQWNPNSEYDLRRYIIYYGKSSGNYTKEEIALKTETEIIITGLQEDTTYYIAIKAEDVGEQKSSYSDEINATTKKEQIIVLVPEGLTAIQEGENIKLKWEHTDPEPDYYIIARKEKEDSFEELGNTTNNEYTDEEVETGKTYVYKVASFKNEEMSEYSEEMEIEVKEKEEPEDNIIEWGIAATIVAISAALAYVFFAFDI